MRKTIEDITVEKTFYKRDRDAFGNRTKKPYQKAVKRKVKVVTEWTRFGHYLIDLLIISAISVGIKFIIPFTFQSSFGFYFTVGEYQFGPSVTNLFVTVAYYMICEATMQRTIGKFATNSVVINEYAEAPSVENLLGRSFSRIVPFEAFSCLSERGWHDKWSNTYVVTEKERDTLKRLLNEDGVYISESEDLLD